MICPHGAQAFCSDSEGIWFSCYCNGQRNVFARPGLDLLVPVYFDRLPSQALCADDIRATKLDRNPWNGEVHDETKLAVLVQVMRSIRDEQIGASSTVRALAEATLDVLGFGNASQSSGNGPSCDADGKAMGGDGSAP
jgi:hypothetical protein